MRNQPFVKGINPINKPSQGFLSTPTPIVDASFFGSSIWYLGGSDGIEYIEEIKRRKTSDER